MVAPDADDAGHEAYELEAPFLELSETDKDSSSNVVLRLLTRAWNSGNLIITLAALVCSTIALFIKQLHGEVPSVQITLISSVISLVVTTAWLLLVGEGFSSLVARSVPLLVMRGVTGAATSILYYQSIQMLHMNEAVTVFFTNPAMAALLDCVINGSVINLGTAAGILLAVGGVVLVGCPACNFAALAAGGMTGTHVAGIAFGLGGAASNAAGYLVVHKIGSDVPFVVLMWWYHALVTLASAAVLLASTPLAALTLPSWHQSGWILAVAVAHFVGQLLLSRGFGLDDATHGSAVFSQQVLYSCLWSVTIMHHPLELCAALGSLSILLGVLLVTESSGSSRHEMQLEQQRQLSTLQRRASKSPSAMDLLAVRIATAPSWTDQYLGMNPSLSRPQLPHGRRLQRANTYS